MPPEAANRPKPKVPYVQNDFMDLPKPVVPKTENRKLLKGQKAIVDQAVEKAGSLHFLLKQAEATMDGLREEREQERRHERRREDEDDQGGAQGDAGRRGRQRDSHQARPNRPVGRIARIAAIGANRVK